MTVICTRTHDGNVIARDGQSGLSASGGTVMEALLELRRRLTQFGHDTSAVDAAIARLQMREAA
jgi:hypothetical protein